jgi:hypothetical protein
MGELSRLTEYVLEAIDGIRVELVAQRRDRFAAAALQGLLAHGNIVSKDLSLVVKYADALIDELDKEKS